MEEEEHRGLSRQGNIILRLDSEEMFQTLNEIQFVLNNSGPARGLQEGPTSRTAIFKK